MNSFGTGRWLSILLCFALLGCIEIVEPSAPPLDAGIGGGGCPGTCSCDPGTMMGRTYRFTSLKVQEPARMASSLDSQWKSEIANHLLNVVFVVNNAERSPESVSNFSKINITAGSAWRSPGSPIQVSDIEGFQINEYCLTDSSLNVQAEVTPKGEAQCTFQNEMTVDLPFHLGPLSQPLMCAPQLTPANATPIKDLKIVFGFNNNCTAITNGSLTGCIPQEAADRICLCVNAGNCGRTNQALSTPFPASFSSTTDLTMYCRNTCGQPEAGQENWANFRALLDMNSGDTDPSHAWPMMPITCELPDGTQGYQLTAKFEAAEITDKFVSDGSGTCSGQ